MIKILHAENSIDVKTLQVKRTITLEMLVEVAQDLSKQNTYNETFYDLFVEALNEYNTKPERKVFYVDVGNMNKQEAKAYVLNIFETVMKQVEELPNE